MHAKAWIDRLNLQPHPEGGFFRETYRATEDFAASALPPRFRGTRSHSTAIYYLLEAGNFSAFHRIHSDEVWHFYAGGPLEIHVVSGGTYSKIDLGLDAERGFLPQAVVPHGAWFAACPHSGTEFSLVGCTVSPGFDFADFELGTVDGVLGALPERQAALARFFR
ncbi:MAG: hypothetical protein RL417_236 [Pseudomonadota bacterium]|jgi:predicted cupin superfamily sugar epimerase